MQILIDMPDEDYDFIKGAEKARYFTPEYYVDLILNGVPLPEHHEKIKEDSMVQLSKKEILNRRQNTTEPLRRSDTKE